MSVINKVADVQANGLSIAEYWDKRLAKMIAMMSDQFVFQKMAKKVKIPKKSGTTTWAQRRYNHLPAHSKTPLTEGVAPTAMKVEGQKVTGTIQHYGALIQISDEAEDVHFDNIRNEYQPELARHALELIENVIIASFSEASEYFVGVGNTDVDDIAATDVLTLKDLRIVKLTATNYLRKGFKGKRFMVVVHDNVMEDLLDDDVLTNKFLLPGNENSPMKKGTLAKYVVFGMDVTSSLICPVEANAATTPVNVYSSFLIGQDSYVMIDLGNDRIKFKETGFDAEKSDPLGQIATVGYKVWTGAKVIDPMAIYQIFSASGFDIIADFTSDDIGAAADQT